MGIFPEPDRSDRRDERPHILVIEEDGWSIEHFDDCPHERDAAFLDTIFYTCPVGHEISHSGLDSLADEKGEHLAWQTLPPGRYQIVFWARYYPGDYGGTYGEEWDVGLEMIGTE